MATLFALGLMNLVWMAAIAALVAVEKLVPWERAATFGSAGLLAVLALLVALGVA
jgi:predicted metal-binding membrane protein